MSEDRFDKLMRDAAATFRRPPEPPLEEMWTAIEARAGLGDETPARLVTSIAPRETRRGFRVPTWVGIAATLLLILNGRVLGITGIVAGLPGRDASWRVMFVGGMILGAALLVRLVPHAMDVA